MYHFLALLAGILISVMVALNGGLAGIYGVHAASVAVHIVGLSLITGFALIKRDHLFAKRAPFYLYLGGTIGVVNVLFTNVPFGRISVSAILALGLLGQGVSGLIVDQTGFMGMPKHPFYKRKLIGLSFILIGIISMITSFELLAVLLAFSAGAMVVFSRTLNAKLAELTSVRISTFYNFFIGLIVALCVYLLFGRSEPGFTEIINLSSSWFLYLGGALGVFIIAISNMVVVKISAFYLSLFIFTGQVAAGIAIDFLLIGEISHHILIGSTFVAAGLLVDLLLDQKRKPTVQK